MAPKVTRTYGKNKTRNKIDKEDTFDKLFKPSDIKSNIFESSSDREKSNVSVKNQTSERDHSVDSDRHKSEYLSVDKTEYSTYVFYDLTKFDLLQIHVKRVVWPFNYFKTYNCAWL